MYQTINNNEFHDIFNAVRPDNFTYEGLNALFDSLEQFEEESGEQVELDVIAICCDYTESTLIEALDAYNLESPDQLRDLTTVIELSNGRIIYIAF